jgi:hypothetical protein
LPPTIHPDTEEPYRWTGNETLLDVAPEELPELPADIADRITAALEPFGYQDAGAALLHARNGTATARTRRTGNSTIWRLATLRRGSRGSGFTGAVRLAADTRRCRSGGCRPPVANWRSGTAT